MRYTFIVLTLAALWSAAVSSPAHAATLIVNTTADNANMGDGFCSLREAVTNSNANADTTGGDCTAGEDRSVARDEIQFAIPGPGPHTISLTADLPIITDRVRIDGLSQPANGGPDADCIDGPLLIVLRGAGARGSAAANGFHFNGASSDDGWIRGLVFQNLDEALLLRTSDDNKVQCNFFGLGADGMPEDGALNWVGIRIRTGSDRNVIGTDGSGINDANERNLIAGTTSISSGYGVYVTGAGTDDNRIAGNWLGLAIDGVTPLSIDTAAVRIRSGAERTIVGTNGDGQGDDAEGNVISGNRFPDPLDWVAAISISDPDTADTRVAGNWIGLSADGTQSVPNQNGVRIHDNASGTVVGTNGDGISDHLEGNIISGHHSGNNNIPYYGVSMEASIRTTVAGNWVGLDATGTRTFENTYGIHSTVSATDLVIGTNSDGISDELERNVVAGNIVGIIPFNACTNVTIAGNWVGLDPTGTIAMPNSTGIRPNDACTNLLVGSNGDGVRDDVEANLISGNAVGIDFIGWSGADNTAVRGNILGVAADGATPIPNQVGIKAFFAAQPRIIGNSILNSSVAGIRLVDTARFSLLSSGNCLVGNTTGVDNNSSAAAVFEENWWGSAGGPGIDGGDTVEGNVDVDPWLTAAPTGCPTAIPPPPVTGDPIVNTTNDDTIAGDGLCTLREAILNAVNDTDTTAGDCRAGLGVDTIRFDILGAVPHTILVASSLPEITATTVVDGLSQPANGGAAFDCTSGPRPVALVGAGGAHGLEIEGAGGAGSVVRGLAIGGFTFSGVEIDGLVSGAVVECNFLGTDATGTLAVANAYGVRLRNGAQQNIVRDNLLSGNTASLGYGIYLRDAGTDRNQVAGNLIGTDVTGTLALPNNVGVRIRLGANDNIVGTDGDGTGDASEGNLISGHANDDLGYAVYLSETGRTRIAGNLIGTDITGLAALPNKVGVRIFRETFGTVVGTNGDGVSDALEGNIISGNTVGLGYGIRLSEHTASNTTIAGNWIGLDATGGAALPNRAGIRMQPGDGGAPSGTVVGSNGDGVSDDLERNVISGNTFDLGYGIYWTGPANATIRGNYIGTDSTGTFAVGNLVGLRIGDFVNLQRSIEGNVISGHTEGLARGIYVSNARLNTFSNNLVGTNAAGTAAIPNKYGFYLSAGARSNTIGPDNVISGNLSSFGQGVRITGVGTDNNTVTGNLIGPSADGGALIADGAFTGNKVGVRLGDGAADNRIEGNVIAGNHRTSTSGMSEGIYASDPGTTASVSGNVIGDADPSDGVDFANGDGIHLADGASLQVTGNRLLGNFDEGLDLRAGATLQAGSTGNCLAGNGTGIDNTSGVLATFTDNWWGAADGPSGAGAGSGDAVSLDVVFSPFLTTAPAVCEDDQALAGLSSILIKGSGAPFAVEVAEPADREEANSGQRERRDRRMNERASREERAASALEAAYDG